MTWDEYVRFCDKIAEHPRGFFTREECWPWTGAKTKDGYAWFYCRGKAQKGHRVAFEHYVGLCPVGLVPDHLCRVRNCVNPWHLEWVTSAVNTQRGVEWRQNHKT